MMEKNKQIDRIRGSLVAGAIGDALGYPIEFDSYEAIQMKYGEKGCTHLDPTKNWLSDGSKNTKAYVSDDTQMTLFTACGLLNAKESGAAPIPSICEAYIEWYFTQIGWKSKRYNSCWIGDLSELNVTRAPGNTCLSALKSILNGREPANNSKGCGGVMRIAPIPLYGAAQGRIKDVEALDQMAADASELTHLHPLGFIPAALMSHVIYRLSSDENPTGTAMREYISEGMGVCRKLYEERYKTSVDYLEELVGKAVELSAAEMRDVDAIAILGEGWVAEEAVAIALYCSLKYFDNIEAALIAAVNHKGDSDSTGAVTGNILGAVVGYEAIPQHFKEGVELLDVILHVADDLWRGETTKFIK